MALIVLLRGVNVGGHRTFRPTSLAAQLRHLDAVNIGAAGTFVIRRPIARTDLRAELRRRLPFDAEAVLCRRREITDLLARNPFSGRPERPDIVRFVSVPSRRPRAAPAAPFRLRGQDLLFIPDPNADGIGQDGTVITTLTPTLEQDELDALATSRSSNAFAINAYYINHFLLKNAAPPPDGEVSSRVVYDAPVQAASVLTPSSNTTPVMTSARSFAPFSALHPF